MLQKGAPGKPLFFFHGRGLLWTAHLPMSPAETEISARTRGNVSAVGYAFGTVKAMLRKASATNQAPSRIASIAACLSAFLLLGADTVKDFMPGETKYDAFTYGRSNISSLGLAMGPWEDEAGEFKASGLYDHFEVVIQPTDKGIVDTVRISFGDVKGRSARQAFVDRVSKVVANVFGPTVSADFEPKWRTYSHKVAPDGSPIHEAEYFEFVGKRFAYDVSPDAQDILIMSHASYNFMKSHSDND